MFAYECVNLLIFIKVVCFYLMHLYNVHCTMGCREKHFWGGGVNGTVVMQARYGAGALWLLNGPVYTPPQKCFSLQPIVPVHKIKTYNFYENK